MAKKTIKNPPIEDIIIPGNGDIDELSANASYHSPAYQTKVLKDIRNVQRKQSVQLKLVNFSLFLLVTIVLWIAYLMTLALMPGLIPMIR